MAETLRTEDRLGHEACDRGVTRGQGGTREAPCASRASVCVFMGVGRRVSREGLRGEVTFDG